MLRIGAAKSYSRRKSPLPAAGEKIFQPGLASSLNPVLALFCEIVLEPGIKDESMKTNHIAEKDRYLIVYTDHVSGPLPAQKTCTRTHIRCTDTQLHW